MLSVDKAGRVISRWFDEAAAKLEELGASVEGHEDSRQIVRHISELEEAGSIPVNAKTLAWANGGARAGELHWMV